MTHTFIPFKVKARLGLNDAFKFNLFKVKAGLGFNNTLKFIPV